MTIPFHLFSRIRTSVLQEWSEFGGDSYRQPRLPFPITAMYFIWFALLPSNSDKEFNVVGYSRSQQNLKNKYFLRQPQPCL